MYFFFSACGIIAAADESESYDTDDIEGRKIISQTSVGVCGAVFLSGLRVLYDPLTASSKQLADVFVLSR